MTTKKKRLAIIKSWLLMREKFWISPLFIIMAVTMVAVGYGRYLLVNGAVLVIHELAHAEMARRRGYKLNSFKLMPYGAALSGDFEGIKAKDEILIALAGPIANLLLAAAFAFFWLIVPASYTYTRNMFNISLVLAVFNLLPLYPLDGGRIVLAAFSVKFKRQKVYKILRIIGIVAAAAFAALGFLVFLQNNNISLAIISIFFFISSLIPDKKSQYAALYSFGLSGEKIKKGVVIKEVLISENASILSLVKMLKSTYYYKFIIVNANGENLTTLEESQLEDIAIKSNLQTSIGLVVKSNKSTNY